MSTSTPPNRPISINSREALIEVAQQLGLAGTDWHEPDNQEIDAKVTGDGFDNAGFYNPYVRELDESYAEIGVTLFKDGVPVAVISLASLFALATGHEGGEVRKDDRTVESVLEAAKEMGPAKQQWKQERPELDAINTGPVNPDVSQQVRAAEQAGVSPASLALGDGMNRSR